MRGGGVVNVNFLACLSTLPSALLVPFGISTVYVVACGKRTSGSKSSVLVPIQRQRPLGVGVSVTGTFAAASAREVTATIGCENVIDSCGAIGTLPSGDPRSTSRALCWSLVAGGGGVLPPGGGKLPWIVAP